MPGTGKSAETGELAGSSQSLLRGPAPAGQRGTRKRRKRLKFFLRKAHNPDVRAVAFGVVLPGLMVTGTIRTLCKPFSLMNGDAAYLNEIRRRTNLVPLSNTS